MKKYEGFGLACGNFKSVDVAEKIFGGENTIQKMMEVEAALARAQAAIGVIPGEACEEICRKCHVELLDEEEFRRQYQITNHPLVPLVRCYAAICEGNAGEYIHFGTTTQDISDTATMLQLKEACGVIIEKAKELRVVLAKKSRQYQKLIMMGRTNDQQAMPITLGFKMASWVDELDRGIERMEQSQERIFVGQFAGAVGTLASLEKNGIEIQRRLMEEVGLGTPKIAWYSSRDRLAELVSNLCILTCSLGRFANEVYIGQKSEVNELAEGFRPGRVGSSTMPHKRNPFVPGQIVAYARLARSVMTDVLTAMEGTNERDCRSLGLEHEILAKSCSLADAALDQSLLLMTELEVHEENIRRNLELLNGLIYAEALMMRLSSRYGRLEAHEMVYEIAQKAISEKKNFKELLLADPRVGSEISEEELREIMNPAHYIGLAEYFVDRVIGQ